MNLNEELFKVAQEEVEDQNRVLELIRQGADVRYVNGNRETPLYWAVRKNHLNICKTLLENGADANIWHSYAPTVESFTVLTRAVHRGNEKMVRLLLENGVDPNFRSEEFLSFLHHRNVWEQAMIMKNSDDIARMLTLLIEHGANVNYSSKRNEPLLWACENKRQDLVELLLYKGAHTDWVDSFSQTPLDIAKEKGFTEIVELFEKDWLGLYHASERGNYDECKALLEKGALVESTQYGQFCAIAAACGQGHYEILQLLLKEKPIVNNKDDNERNPLYLATKNGHKDIVSLLLKTGGASPLVKVKGDTLLHVATRNNHSDLVQLLIQRGLKPNLKNQDGYAALHYAAIEGNENVVAILIQHGTKVNLTTNKMETPLHLACEALHKKIVSILLKNRANTEILSDKNEKPKDIIDRKRKEMEQPNEDELEILDNIKNEINQYSIGNLEQWFDS